MPLNWANIQGNILRPYTHPYATFVFFCVEEATRAKEWLREITGHVTTAEPWEEKPATTLNVMFTCEGLRALGLETSLIETFSPEFQQGMAARRGVLGDTEENSPGRWENGLGTPGIHILVSIYALQRDAHPAPDGAPRDLKAKLAWLAELTARTGGVRMLLQQEGVRLMGQIGSTPTALEHFGFVDGLSQPAIELDGLKWPPGYGAPEKRNAWRPIKLGEFLLGYPNEGGLLPRAPSVPALAQDATYVVYRKLRQDVAGFRSFLKEQAYQYPGGDEALAARILGRWRDGTPVALCPHRRDPSLAADPQRNNDFRYRDDADGYRCPLGAHIRRVNPRDALPFGAVMVNRHRIIRRGIPYGEPLPEGARDDGQDRGLLFICCQANIGRQFEFIQEQWLNDGNKLGLGRDRDLLAGNGGNEGKMTLQGSPPRFLAPLRPFVTVRGGDYFYMPGIAGLHFLSSLRS